MIIDFIPSSNFHHLDKYVTIHSPLTSVDSILHYKKTWLLSFYHSSFPHVTLSTVLQVTWRTVIILYFPGNFSSDLTLEDFQGYETSLQTLVLAENSLTLIPEGIFRTLDNLRTLNLRGNNILTINAQAFQVRQRIQWLVFMESTCSLTTTNFQGHRDD